MATHKSALEGYDNEVSKLPAKEPGIGRPTWNSDGFFKQRPMDITFQNGTRDGIIQQ